MYKKQLTFQRIVCYAMLIAAALVFVYSLGLMTDLYDTLYNTMPDPEDLTYTYVEGSIIYYDMQPFNGKLTMVGIGLILANLVLFITCTHSRRKYYIGNFFAVALSTGCNAAASVWAVQEILKYKEQFLTTVNFEQLKEYSVDWNAPYSDSTFWFDACYVVFGFLLLVTVLLIINLILKLIVMKEEKRLIGSRKDVRA